jgi:ligand-binding sensor domain-containing protein
MKKTLRLLQNLLLLTLFVYSTACNGKSEMQSQSAKSENITPIGQPKLINSQGPKKNENVSCGLQDRNGNLWFGTGSGVYRYDGKLFFNYTTNEGLNNNSIKCIMEDKAGNIWFGGRTNEGVYRYDGKSVVNLKLDELFQDGPEPKPHNWGWPQWQDKNGNIWFSNWGGAYKYDGKSFTSYTKKDGLFGIVARIIEDNQGKIWFGGDGVNRFDGKSFTRFTTKDGLPNLGIWSILEDKNENVWVGTRETGLYLYDGKTFITYSEYKHSIK